MNSLNAPVINDSSRPGEIDMCSHLPCVTRKQMAALMDALAKANPTAQWSIKTERMGVDKDDNIISVGFWFKAETFKLSGVPVFELVRRPGRTEINDLRNSSRSGENHE